MKDEFISKLNGSFKTYLDSDDGSLLPEFETAVIFVLKRKAVSDYLLQQHEQKSNSEVQKVNARVDQLDDMVKKLTEELASLKSTARQTKNQLEKLSFDNNDEKNKKDVDCAKKIKKEKKLKHTCFICWNLFFYLKALYYIYIYIATLKKITHFPFSFILHNFLLLFITFYFIWVNKFKNINMSWFFYRFLLFLILLLKTFYIPFMGNFIILYYVFFFFQGSIYR